MGLPCRKEKWKVESGFMRDNIRKQIQGRWFTLLAASIFIEIYGISFVLLCLLGVNNGEQFLHCLVLLLHGIISGVLGCWGIHISSRKKVVFSKDSEVIMQGKMTLLIGWFYYACGLIMLPYASVMLLDDDVQAWILGFISPGLLLIGTICFSAYRYKRVEIVGDRVDFISAFGKRYGANGKDIKVIRVIGKQCCIVEVAGKQLFWCAGLMGYTIGLKQLNLPGKVKGKEGLKPALLQWNPEDETWQTRNVKVLRTGWYCLVGLNMLTYLFLTGWCTDTIIGFSNRMLLITLQPFLYLIYGWIFRDVVNWGTIIERNATKEWKKKHVMVGMAGIHLVLLMCREIPFLMNKVHIIGGKKPYYLLGAGLFLVFMGVTVARLGKVPNKKMQIGIIAAYIFINVMWGLTPAVLLVSSGLDKRVHYTADILQKRETAGRWKSWYVTVRLLDGQEEEMEVSQCMYRDIVMGKRKVLCENEALWGIRYISLHNPED